MKLAAGNTSLQCDYCKAAVELAPDETGVQFLDEVRGLYCPVCESGLWHAVLASVELVSCKKCRGFLVRMSDFEVLIEKMRAVHAEREFSGPANAADLERKVMCPRCHRRMDTHYYFGGGHAVMSSCERCELHWLDSGMLMRIMRLPKVAEE